MTPTVSAHPLAQAARVWLARHGAALACLLGAALIAVQLASLAWRVLPAGRHPPPDAMQPVLRTPQADHGQVLLAAHLFGSEEAPVSGAGVQRSQVALVLAGTLAGRDPAHGLAIIGETAQNAKLYATGTMLPGGVRLHSVYADHVLLERGGALESLSLPHVMTGAGTHPASVATGPGLGASVQHLIAQDPGIVGQVLRPQPVFANGALQGFRLYPGSDRRKFQALGLIPGDLVTQVNGVPLSDPQHGLDVLKTLGSAGSAAVTIERSGTTQTLTFDSAKLASLAGPDALPAGPPATGTSPSPRNADP